MEKPTGEGRIAEQTPIADILNGYYRVHWTGVENLPKALSRGIYSGKFALRIGDEEYFPYSSIEKHVWLTSTIPSNVTRFSSRDAVGILIRRSSPASSEHERELLRIAPREFAGIVIPDDYDSPRMRTAFQNPKKAREFTKQRIGEIEAILKKEDMLLPIYGSTGNLYSPRKMSHDQIVRGNFEERNPLINLLQAVSRIRRRRP